MAQTREHSAVRLVTNSNSVMRTGFIILATIFGQACIAQTLEFPIGTILEPKAAGCKERGVFIYTDPRIEIDGYHAVDYRSCKGRNFIVISRLADVANNQFEVVRSYRLPNLRKAQSFWGVNCAFLPDPTLHAFAIGNTSARGAGAKLTRITYAAILVPKSMEIVPRKSSEVSCGYEDDRD